MVDTVSDANPNRQPDADSSIIARCNFDTDTNSNSVGHTNTQEINFLRFCCRSGGL
jgi:hypothetical protein